MNVDAGREIIDCRYNKQTANYRFYDILSTLSDSLEANMKIKIAFFLPLYRTK